MGNKASSLYSATPPPPPPQPTGCSPQPDFFDNCGTPKPQTPVSQPRTNPGSFIDLHKRCKDIFPSAFDGIKVALNRGLSNSFQVSHTLQMSPVGQSTYRFGCVFAGGDPNNTSEANSQNTMSPDKIGDIVFWGFASEVLFGSPPAKTLPNR